MRIASAFALLVLAGCQVFGLDGGVPEPYLASLVPPQEALFSRVETPIAAPDTVRAGERFEVTLTTLGTCGGQPYRTEKKTVAGGFELRAYNLPSPPPACMNIVPPEFEHVVTLSADDPGRLVVRAVDPDDRFERVVVVQ